MSGETYVEFIQVGDYMRVAAIDAATGTEVVIMGPAHAARADLQRLALAKLNRALNREKLGASTPDRSRPGRIA